jgi:hypothetical protein
MQHGEHVQLLHRFLNEKLSFGKENIILNPVEMCIIIPLAI